MRLTKYTSSFSQQEWDNIAAQMAYRLPRLQITSPVNDSGNSKAVLVVSSPGYISRGHFQPTGVAVHVHKRENYQNCSVPCCVRQLCTHIRTPFVQLLKMSVGLRLGLGFVHLFRFSILYGFMAAQ